MRSSGISRTRGICSSIYTRGGRFRGRGKQGTGQKGKNEGKGERGKDRVRRRVKAISVALTCLGLAAVGAGQTRPQGDRLPVLNLLDRYERGDHEAVVAELAEVSDIAGFAREVQRRVEGWTRAAQASPE